MFEKFRLLFQKLNKSARIPERAHETDAGVDLFSSVKTEIPAGGDAVVKTGLRCLFTDGYVMVFKDKSGRSVKDKLRVGAGVIDSQYRGELLIHVFNHGEKDITIKKGEKVAQFLILPCWTGQPREVKLIGTETDRGEGKMGSTGI